MIYFESEIYRTFNLRSFGVARINAENSLGHHKYRTVTLIFIVDRNSTLILVIFDLRFIWYSAMELTHRERERGRVSNWIADGVNEQLFSEKYLRNFNVRAVWFHNFPPSPSFLIFCSVIWKETLETVFVDQMCHLSIKWYNDLKRW